LLPEICGLVSIGRPLWREDGSAICSVITQWSESLRTRNHTLLSHLRLPQPRGTGSRIYIPQEQGGPVIPPQALGSLYVASYDSQSYGGGIVTLREPGGPGPCIYIPQERDGPVQSQNHVTVDSQSVSMSWCLVHSALKGFHPKNFNCNRNFMKIRKVRLFSMRYTKQRFTSTNMYRCIFKRDWQKTHKTEQQERALNEQFEKIKKLHA
jgi:hypothetical protein